MKRSMSPFIKATVRLGAAAITAVAAVGVSTAAMSDSKPAETRQESPTVMGDVLNPWAIGDAALARNGVGFHAAQALPDLTDPDVRRRFVCSFAPGSFGISVRSPASEDAFCAAGSRSDR